MDNMRVQPISYLMVHGEHALLRRFTRICKDNNLTVQDVLLACVTDIVEHPEYVTPLTHEDPNHSAQTSFDWPVTVY